MKANRDKKEYWASFIQRVSGVVLALFLPFHFLVLSLALQGGDALNNFLYWADAPLVKFAEAGLVGLLTIHFLGGSRILLIEFFSWQEWQGRLITVAGGGAVATGCLFLLRAI
ncbi:MAG: fumarate reductase subunit D [Motiliproteus sp.]|jgi:fumarate reductase subunit D